MHDWITGQKSISDQFPVRTMATWNRMRPRGSLQVSGIDFDGPFLLNIFLLLQIVSAFLDFFFFLELINNSASNSSFIKINARFVRHQLYSRMWKLSSLLCCQYITVGSQPYKTPLRPCLFCISTPSLPPFSWLSPTSSSSHLSFSICLSSCNISVWPFHPHSLVCPSHLV